MDPNQVEQFHSMLRGVVWGRFAIYSSHQIGGVTRVADRVAILHDGQIRGVIDAGAIGKGWSAVPSTDHLPPTGTDPDQCSWFLSEDGDRLYLQTPDSSDGERLDVDHIFALATRT
jgi:ABC-type multidrug transport system ATPase subunit